MIALRNNFHNTEVRLRASIGDTLTPAQLRRARRELCGTPTCVCGGEAGERGPQWHDGRPFGLEVVGPNRVRLVTCWYGW